METSKTACVQWRNTNERWHPEIVTEKIIRIILRNITILIVTRHTDPLGVKPYHIAHVSLKCKCMGSREFSNITQTMSL